MKKFYCKQSQGWFLAPLLAFTGVVAGCGDATHISAETAQGQPLTGSLTLALTARGNSGDVYQLRNAEFSISNGLGTSRTTLSTETAPGSSTLEADLPPGSFEIFLAPGWHLERVQNGDTRAVEARLVSSEVQGFEISPGDETRVRYRFETNGETIEFGVGRLVVELAIDELNGESDLVLGPPLVLEAGFIHPDSNQVGLGAAVYTVAAPLGSAIELTQDDGRICVEGGLDPVVNDNFEEMWGAEVGLAFLDLESVLFGPSEPLPGDELTPVTSPWRIADHGVVGLSYRIEGQPLPPMRFSAQPAGGEPGLDHHCSPRSPFDGIVETLAFDELDRQCWLGDRDPLVAPSLDQVGWTLPADFEQHPFQFCIEDIRPVLTPR